MKKFLCILYLLSAVFLSSSVYAGNRAGDLTLSAGGGYYFFDSNREIQNSGFGFGSVGFNFSPHWGIEALVGGFTTSFKPMVEDDRSISATIFTLDGIYRFGAFDCFFEPYVFAGVGILGLSHNRNDANNEGNINAGVGLEFFVANTLAFRADARDLYTITYGKNDVMLTAGMTVLFNLC